MLLTFMSSAYIITELFERKLLNTELPLGAYKLWQQSERAVIQL